MWSGMCVNRMAAGCRPSRRRWRCAGRGSRRCGIGSSFTPITYENLIEAGVIDPTKVVRFAIQNASSIASLMLTTEAIVADIPEKQKAAPMPPGGGMDDY